MTTASNRVQGQRAYVLHVRPYKETSSLVDYLCEDFGRVRLVVKGARRPKSKLRIALQAFAPLAIDWQGRSDLKTLAGAESLKVAPFWQGRSLWCGLYLNELLTRTLTLWDAHPRLFAYYRFALEHLHDEDEQQAVLRIFERNLLQEMGFGLDFSRTADSGEAIQAAGFYRLEPEQGFVAASEDDQTSAQYSGASLLAIAADNYQDMDTRRAAKHIMRAALAPHLGDKPLMSRTLFEQHSLAIQPPALES